jgi:hypothetical protein
MSRKDLAILVHLGNELKTLTGTAAVRIEHMDRGQMMQCVIIPLKEEWKLDLKDIPSYETFYTAFRKKNPGCAFYEKLAFFLYAKKNKMSIEQMQAIYRFMAGSKKLSVRPYWDRYKKEHLEENKKRIKPKVKVKLEGFINGLDMVDTAAAYILLNKKVAKGNWKWRKEPRRK